VVRTVYINWTYMGNSSGPILAQNLMLFEGLFEFIH
jgi:hypothetical protein